MAPLWEGSMLMSKGRCGAVGGGGRGDEMGRGGMRAGPVVVAV